MKIIYRMNGNYNELLDAIEPSRDSSGIARGVLIRNCKIVNVPAQVRTIYELADSLNIQDSIIKNSNFSVFEAL